MIQLLRKKFSKKTSRVILIVTALSIAGIGSLASIFKRVGHENSVVVVNGHPISRILFKHKLQSIEHRIAYIRQQFGENAQAFLYAMGMQETPQEIALQELTQEALLVSCADSLPIIPSENYIIEKLDDPSFIIQNLGDFIPPQAFDALGGINPQYLARILQMQGLSIQDFESILEEIIKRKMLLDLIQESLYIPTFLVKVKYIQDYVAKDFTIISFPFEYYSKKAHTDKLSPEQLQAYFQIQNAKNRKYWQPEERNGRFWSFDMNHYGLTVTEKEKEEYYNKNKSNFIDKPEQIQIRSIFLKVDEKHPESLQREKIEKIYQHLMANPHDFQKYADEYSDEAPKAEWIKKDTKNTDPAIEAAFNLKNDGDISLPIRTSKGFTLIGRAQKKEPLYKSFAQTEKEINQKLLEEKFKKSFILDARRVINEQDYLEELVSKKKGTLSILTNVQKDLTSQSKKIFEIIPGKKTFFIENNKGYIIELLSIDSAHAVPFENVKEKVKKDWENERAQQLLTEAMNGYSKNPQAQEGVIIRSYKKVKPQSNDFENLKKEGVPVESFNKLSRPGVFQQAMTDKGGYLIQLDSIAGFDTEEFKKYEKELRGQLTQEYMGLLLNSFIASLHKHATIKVNQNLFKSGN